MKSLILAVNRKVWGRCNGCAGWNGCCWRAKDLICEAHNLGCKGLRAVAYAALELAKKVVDESRWTLDVAKGALRAAESIVNDNRWPLDVAKGILEEIKVTVKAGIDSAKAIVNLGLGGVFGIRKIEFDIMIGLVQEGHFNGNLEVTILGKVHKFGFELRLKSVKDMVLDLADRIFPGISGRSKREVEDRMKRAFPDFSEKHHFPRIYRPGSHTRRTAALKRSSLSHVQESRGISAYATSSGAESVDGTAVYRRYVRLTTQEMEDAAIAQYRAVMEGRSSENDTGINTEIVMNDVQHFVENQTQYTGYKISTSSQSNDAVSGSEDDTSPDLPSVQSCSDVLTGKLLLHSACVITQLISSLISDSYRNFCRKMPESPESFRSCYRNSETCDR